MKRHHHHERHDVEADVDEGGPRTQADTDRVAFQVVGVNLHPINDGFMGCKLTPLKPAETMVLGVRLDTHKAWCHKLGVHDGSMAGLQWL